MKKLLLSFIFVFLVFSLKAGIIEKTYHFSNYKIVKFDDYQIITFKNTLAIGKIGEPVLPYHSISLLLPPGEVADTIEFYGEDETEISGKYQLYPQQYSHPISKGKSGKFVKKSHIYQKNIQYPTSSTGILSTEFMNGYSFAISTFTPVKYNPSTGSISFYKKVTIKIKTKKGEKAENALNNLNSSKDVLTRVKEFSQNPELISQYPEKKVRDNDYQMLIITSYLYQNDFQNLINLYSKRGIKTQVVSTQYIDVTISGQDLQEKIRNYIIQEYQNHGIEYVLLAGDVEVVPYRGFYCKVYSSQIYEDNNIPSDLYYSALDGNWNENGNNKWGEYIISGTDTLDEADLLPEVSVGRFSFSNTDELNNMLNKTISYQDNPVLGELRKPLLAGEHLYDEPLTWGADYMDLLIGHHEDNGYTTDGIPEDQNIEKLYDKNATWSGSTIMAKINEGHSFLNHVGHANETYVMRLYLSDITNSNFYNVNGINHNYTIVYTHGCLCGAFDYDDCIAEKMVSIANFAAAFVGNSRYGWFNEGQTEGPSEHINREFINALYGDKIGRIGTAHKISKQETAPWVTAPGQFEEGALRWCFYDCNVLGDPAMSIWTDEPIDIQTNYQEVIPVDASSMNVNVSSNGTPVENLNCVLMKDSVIHGVGTTDSIGNTVININPPIDELGAAQLIVSGYNCLATTYPVTIIPCDVPDVIYSSYEINDSSGNNDGLVNYGESINLGLEVINIGSQQATNVNITLSSEDTCINITDSTENYGDIDSGAVVYRENAFAFDVANNIPDNHLITFNVTAISEDTTISNFNITAYAPNLSIGNLTVNDTAGGNANGILEPGETADIIIQSSNIGHSDCFNTNATLTTTNNYVTINNDNYFLDTLAQGTTKNAIFTITVDTSTLIGTNIDLNYKLISGEYNVQKTFYKTVGIIYEDFETGDFSSYDWNFGGDQPWTITNSNPYEGNFCAKSGQINDLSTSELFITFNVLSDDSISFFRKVSSEDNYDFLKFYIDNNEFDKWSGEKSWQRVAYPVTTGEHTFKWEYIKDAYVSNGSDCGWIDYIVFPPVSLPVSVNDIDKNNISLNVFPNPFNDKITINYSNENASNVKITIYNALGQKIKILTKKQNQKPGNHSIIFNASGLQKGIYFCKFETNNYTTIKKLILSK